MQPVRDSTVRTQTRKVKEKVRRGAVKLKKREEYVWHVSFVLGEFRLGFGGILGIAWKSLVERFC